MPMRGSESGETGAVAAAGLHALKAPFARMHVDQQRAFFVNCFVIEARSPDESD